MAVTEPQRLALHAAARAALGETQGDTLMALVPPANTDIATRQDLTGLRSEIKSDITELRTELKSDIAELRSEFKADVAELRSELKSDIAELRLEVRTDIARLRVEMMDRFDQFQWRIIGTVVLTIIAATFLGRML
jgi:actin-like ATPase involved in cell morphogenesis